MIDLSVRDKYLAQLGVLPWYARKRLIGAAKTPAFIVGREDAGAVVVDASDELEVAATVSSGESAGSALQLLEGVGLEVSPEKEVHDHSENVAHEVVGTSVDGMPQESVSSFVLRAYYSGEILVTTESSPDYPQELERNYLCNFLFQCKAGAVQQVDLLDSFSWPAFSAVMLSNYQDNRKPDLMARWLTALSQNSGRLHIHFGMACSKDISAWRDKYDSSEFRFVTVEYSLAEQIALPSRKASAWRQVLEHRPL